MVSPPVTNREGYSCSVHVWLVDWSQVNAPVQVLHSKSFNALNGIYMCKCESTYQSLWPLRDLQLMCTLRVLFYLNRYGAICVGIARHLAVLILVINFLCFPVSKPSTVIGWLELPLKQTHQHSHCRKL